MRQVGGRLFWVRSSLLSLLLLFVREGGFGWRIEKKGGERGKYRGEGNKKGALWPREGNFTSAGRPCSSFRFETQ